MIATPNSLTLSQYGSDDCEVDAEQPHRRVYYRHTLLHKCIIPVSIFSILTVIIQHLLILDDKKHTFSLDFLLAALDSSLSRLFAALLSNKTCESNDNSECRCGLLLPPRLEAESPLRDLSA